MLPGMVRGGIEKAGTEALGTEVTVERVRLSLLRSRVQIQGLDVAAPEGFDSNTFLRVERAIARVSLRSLLTSTILVREVDLSGLRLNLDVRDDGATSLRALLEGMPEDEPEEEEEEDAAGEDGETGEATGKGILVHRLALSDLRVAVRDHYAWEELVEAIVEMEDLDIRDIHLPPPGVDEGRTMDLTLTNLSVMAAGRFSNPVVYHIGELKVEADLPTLLATAERPRIHLPNLEYRDSTIHFESTERAGDKPEPENLQEVLVAFQNATGDEPARLTEIKARADEEKPRQEEERRARRPSAEGLLNAAAGLFQEGESGDVEPVEIDGGEAETAELPFESLRLDRLVIENVRLAMRDGRDESKNLDSTLHELTGADLVHPADPAVRSTLALRATPAGEGSTLTVQASGNLGMPEEGQSAEMEVSVVRLPMDRAGEVESGWLDSDLKAGAQGRVVEGTLRLRTEELRLRRSNMLLDNLTSGPVAIALSDEDGLTIPFRITVDDPAWRIILQGLLLEILKEAPRAALRHLEGKTVGEIAGEVERLAEEMGVSGDRLREELGRLESLGGESIPSSEKIEETLRGAGDALEGLFRRGNRDRED